MHSFAESLHHCAVAECCICCKCNGSATADIEDIVLGRVCFAVVPDANEVRCTWSGVAASQLHVSLVSVGSKHGFGDI